MASVLSIRILLMMLMWHRCSVRGDVPDEINRFTCWPERSKVTQGECEARGCVWLESGTKVRC